jgi:hypothetical protein
MAVESDISTFYEAWKSGHYTKKILIEGDSWVSHPFPEVTNLSTQIDGFRTSDTLILNIAEPGDEAESIFAPHGRQMKRLKRLLHTDQWGETFDLILLSTGGNDIVGPEIKQRGFVMNKRDFPNVYGKDLLTRNFYQQVADVVTGYEGFLAMKADNEQNRKTPVITHTYAYLTPRKVGTHLGPIMFNEGWISIHLGNQGITDPDEQYEIVVEMLDTFYREVRQLEASHDDFYVVDTRQVLLGQDGKPDPNLWSDEIHPNTSGFNKVAEFIRSDARREGMWYA